MRVVAVLHHLNAYRQLLAVEVAGVELRVWLLHVACCSILRAAIGAV
jgi:hypothetical protein